MAKAASMPIDDDKEWQAKHDLHTLVEAEKIKADSKRLAAARKCADKERKALNKVGKDS